MESYKYLPEKQKLNYILNKKKSQRYYHTQNCILDNNRNEMKRKCTEFRFLKKIRKTEKITSETYLEKAKH